jgi:hypothetical protein
MIRRVAFVVLAVTVGIAVDLIGSALGTLFSLVGLGILDELTGSSLLSTVLTTPDSSPLQAAFFLFFVGVATTLGAFVAARFAGLHTLAFGLLFAAASLLVSAFFLEFGSPTGFNATAWQVIHILVVILASLLGAFLESLYSRRRVVAA